MHANPRTCAFCKAEFSPDLYHPKQRYCTPRCRQRAGAARNRDAITISRRNYKARNREKLRADGREHYQKTKHLAEHIVRRRTNVQRWRVENAVFSSFLARHWKHKARFGSEEGVFTFAEWVALVEIAGGVCLRCLASGTVKTLTIDHVIPISMGGKNEILNIQPLCRKCNAIKAGKNTDYRTVKQLVRIVQLVRSAS